MNVCVDVGVGVCGCPSFELLSSQYFTSLNNIKLDGPILLFSVSFLDS